MIVQFTHLTPSLSIGEFNSSHIEIKNEVDREWTIYVNGKATKSGPFITRKAAINQVQILCEKIIKESMPKVVAHQKPLSPRPIDRRSAPFSRR